MYTHTNEWRDDTPLDQQRTNIRSVERGICPIAALNITNIYGPNIGADEY